MSLGWRRTIGRYFEIMERPHFRAAAGGKLAEAGTSRKGHSGLSSLEVEFNQAV